MITQSDRTAYVGLHTTPELKDWLQKEAARRQTSMSALLHEALKNFQDKCRDEELVKKDELKDFIQ